MDELESALDAHLIRQLAGGRDLDAGQMHMLYQTSLSLITLRAGRAKYDEIPMHRHRTDGQIEVPQGVLERMFGADVKVVLPLNHPDHPANQGGQG